MKYFISFLLILILAACSKEAGYRRQFAGKWEYERYSGYPFNNTLLPPGNGRIIILNDDGSYEKRSHDTLLFTGRYSIKQKKDCQPSDNNLFFSSDDNKIGEGYIEVINDKLTISSSNCLADGGTTIYRRLQ